MKRPLLAIMATVAALVSTGLANGSTSSGAATVAIAKTKLGMVLVDGKGRTLYDFVKDKGAMSSCYGACAALWPPLFTKGKPHPTPATECGRRCSGRRSATTARWRSPTTTTPSTTTSPIASPARPPARG